MAKRINIILFSFVLAILLVSSLEGFFTDANRVNPNNPNDTRQRDYTRENSIKPVGEGGYYGGHDTITAEGMLLKKEVHKGEKPFEDFADTALSNLRTGAHDEDSTKLLGIPMQGYEPPMGPNGSGNYFQHYYNPDDGQGYSLTHSNSAVQRAMDYNTEIRRKIGCPPGGIGNLSTEDKQKIYDLFGRSLHLLQDMAHPSHTNDSGHINAPFEEYLNNHWGEIVNSKEIKEAVTAEKYKNGDYSRYSAPLIEYFMHDLAKISKQYPTEGQLYDLVLNPDGTTFSSVLNQERLMKNVQELVPEAIKYTAGYINAIYNYMNNPYIYSSDCDKPPTPVSPAGDHPDDRFDVSDEFYWEKEFNLTEADLAELYLRTAIKKGKIGGWYKKQFMDILIEGRTSYRSAPQELKNAIEANFQAIKNKLEQRKNQIESDWKGAPDIALFANGFYNPSISLMLKIGEPVSFQDIDFNPEMLKDHPVLLVPTGGFYGLKNSNTVKAILEEYVRNGGSLVLFTQQHGFDWELLPTPADPVTGERRPVTGYGYQEDQSCQFNSVYIDTHHPILSSFSTSTANIGVDGYFSSYPEGSTILLRRIANGQPAMILYPYGQGQVIATTLYTDFAFSHHQANQAEINLVQNIISWAKKPGALAQIKPGETVSVSVTLKNHTDAGAASAKFIIMDSDKKVITEQTQASSIAAGQSAVVSVSYTSLPTSSLGIYHVDYTLLGAQGNIIQPQAETDSGRFVVGNPPKSGTPDKPIWFSVTTTSQEVLYGTPFDYTFHVYNHTNETRNLTIRTSLRHTNRSHEWIVVADPNQETTVSGTDLFLDSTWMFETMEAFLYDESGRVIGGYGLSFKGFYPSASISVHTYNKFYTKRDSVIISTILKNNAPLSWQSNVKITVSDQQNKRIFEDPKTIVFSPYGTGSEESFFSLSPTLGPGTYTVQMEAWYGNRMLMLSYAKFELIQSEITVTPNLTRVFTSGINEIPFVFNNIGQINVYSGTLDISLKGPEGTVVFSGSQPFTLGIGENRTINIPIPISPIQFGTYTLTYCQSDETRMGSPVTISILCTTLITLSFDKPSYRIRETANLTVEVTNTGSFGFENALVTVSVPDTGFTDTRSINFGPGQILPLRYVIQIPETTGGGQHGVNVNLTLPGGGSAVQSSNFSVPGSSLRVGYSGSASVAAGDTINLVVQNAGGVDTEFTYRVTLADGSIDIFQNTIEDSLQAGASKTFSFQIPSQVTAGTYLLKAEVIEKKTNKETSFMNELTVSGIQMGLSVRTDKDIYFYTEDITVLSQLMIQDYGVDHANLHLEIISSCLEPISFHFSTWNGTTWEERGLLHFSNLLETKLIDLSAYLPDESGENKVRIKHVGEEDARIDFISLISGDTAYIPTSARNLDTNEDILYEVSAGDNQTAYVLNNEIEVRWSGVPASTDKILLMRAQEGVINYSCQRFAYWQEDIPITQGANNTLNIARIVNLLHHRGQFYLKGTLRSRTGQVVAEAESPFNIVDGEIVLRLHPDKPVYRPGETVRISGEVVNTAVTEVPEITLEILDNQWVVLYTESFNLPANGRRPFSFSTTASAAGSYVFNGYVYQGPDMDRLDYVREKYDVANPALSATASAPAFIGHGAFQLSVMINNAGRVPAVVHVAVSGGSLSDYQSITLQPEETKQILYNQSITSATTYEIQFTGDLNQVLTVPVGYGERATLSINLPAIHPEGKVTVPLTVSNPSQAEEAVEVSIQLWQGETVIFQESRTYALPPGGGTADTLYFDLAEGDYKVVASSQLPVAHAEASFSVKKGDKLVMDVSVGAQADGLIPITVNLANLGYNPVSGSVHCSVEGGQNGISWGSQQAVVQLTTQNSQPLTFNINPSAIPPGSYTLKVEFLSDSGQPLSVRSSSFTVQGASFQISQLPGDQTFSPGQEAPITFWVKNTGNQEGELEFHLKAYDLIDLTKREWLKAGEEKALSFSFRLPEDLEEKDYFAEYELKGQGSWAKGQVKYHLAGINLRVISLLDKAYYKEGETALLTISVSSLTSFSSGLNLVARVNYPGYESRQPFTMNGSQAVLFDIPLTKITGEKLFLGIYHESGRSIHLNSLYIHKEGDVLTLRTDKQVYKPGETVVITVGRSDPAVSGALTLTAPNYEETFSFSGTASKSFLLPSTITAGTYYISYQLSMVSGQNYKGSYPFDVEGIQVKVKGATLDRTKYAPADTINLSLMIESNQNLSATLRTWVVDPEKEYTATGTQGVTLTNSEPFLAKQNLPFTTTKLGVHQLVYGIYVGDLLLCSGSEAFDMGEAVVLGVSADQADYPAGYEPVIVKAGIYGTGPTILDFLVDGQSMFSQSISLSGFSKTLYTLPAVSPGRHSLKARLTSGGLISTKETSFTYGSGLADLTVWMFSDRNIASGIMKFTITVINRGKSPSVSTTLYLYDGPIGAGVLLDMLEVKSLAPGESQSFTYNLSVLGRAGGNTLSTWIDPAGKVQEFDKANNEAKITFTIPELTLSTNLEKEVYSPGETIAITGLITNLSKDPLAGFTMTTTVRDAALLPVYTDSRQVPSIGGLATISINVPWPTDANLPEGVYTISQTLQGRETSTQKIVRLELDKDFTITADYLNQKIETGETVQYDLILAPQRGFTGEVSLSIKDCPSGFTASFTSNPISLSGGSTRVTLKMIPTGQVRIGSYAVKVNASGGGRSHELVLGLGLTDFQMIVVPGTQNIKLLDGVTYTITLIPLNGFDSPVTLEVQGVPIGMRANLDASQVSLPKDVRLSLATSKWLLPKLYTVTVTAKGRAVNHSTVATLVVGKNLLINPGIIAAPGPGPTNKPIINSFRIDGSLINQFQAFDSKYSVNLAAGDLDGDGIDEVIVGTGYKDSRSPALLGIFKRDGTPVAVMEVEHRDKKNSLTVAAGDIDGDWIEEVAVGSYPYPSENDDEENNNKDSEDESGGGQDSHRQRGCGTVRIYKVIGGQFIDTGLALRPYEGEGYRGAPNIAFGDVDGDGVPELITAPGPDPIAPARIKVFKIDTKEGMGRWKVGSQLADLNVPFGCKMGDKNEDKRDCSKKDQDGYGANVAAGDLDGDGKAEILLGAGPDPKKNGQVIILHNSDGVFTAESFIAHEGSRYGISISSEDVDGDGMAEILTGLGPDPKNKSLVRIFRREGILMREFQAYPNSMKYGVRVSRGTVGE
jgi:uncharacterized membrane protein